MLPVDFQPAAGQPKVNPALTYLCVPRWTEQGNGEPFVPWGKRVLAEAAVNHDFVVCLTVGRSNLNPPNTTNPTLVVYAKGVDPRTAEAAAPIIEVPLNLQLMRNPANAGGLIQQHVKSFDDFVFVISE